MSEIFAGGIVFNLMSQLSEFEGQMQIVQSKMNSLKRESTQIGTYQMNYAENSPQWQRYQAIINQYKTAEDMMAIRKEALVSDGTALKEQLKYWREIRNEASREPIGGGGGR
jgi:hypothetical protein